MLYILTRVLDARNLCDGLKLGHGKFGIKGQLQLHHIFPKKRLYDETPEPLTARDDEEDEIAGIVALASRLGIAPPEPHYEVCDDETGDVLATTDLAWPQGVQPGRTQPVALLAPDHGVEAHLGERGWSFFTSKQRLVWHLEKLLGIDIDGDEIIGEVEPADAQGAERSARGSAETPSGWRQFSDAVEQGRDGRG